MRHFLLRGVFRKAAPYHQSQILAKLQRECSETKQPVNLRSIILRFRIFKWETPPTLIWSRSRERWRDLRLHPQMWLCMKFCHRGAADLVQVKRTRWAAESSSVKWRKIEEYKIPQLLGTLLASISLCLSFLCIVGAYSVCHLVSCFPHLKNSWSNNFNYQHNILY